ncbi:MAG: hypothetical protein GY845_17850 [Planctomycetes bacterium]|nr:hypothetical protein [Planctomycetota bacterium]
MRFRNKYIIYFIEEWYRGIIAASLIGHLGFLLLFNGVSLPFVSLTCVYCIYTIIVYGVLKKRITYSIDRHRFVRTVVDTIFLLVLVGLTGGAKSPAFALLAVPIFFASYRFPARKGNLVTLSIIIGYIFTCLLVEKLSIEIVNTVSIAKIGVLLFVWFSNKYSRILQIKRIMQANSIAKAAPIEEQSLNAVAEKVCNALDAQMSFVFTEKEGRYELDVCSEHSEMKQKKHCLSKKNGINISLSEEFMKRKGSKGEHFRLLSSDDKSILFEKPLGEVTKGTPLEKSGIESIIGSFFVYPQDETKKMILAVNKLRRISSHRNARSIQDFRREDLYLLEFVIDRIVSDILFQVQKTDAETYNAMVDEGVAEEICTINKEYETTSINKVKREFFNLYESAVGEKCYKLYHNLSEPCEICKSYDAFYTDQIVEWVKPFHHPITGRPHIASIKAKRIQNRKGEYEVMETVHDLTNERKYMTLTDFILALQEKIPNIDEQKFAAKAVELFGKLGFERARFYEYEPSKQRFVCLASYGMKNDLGYRKFYFTKGQDDVSKWMDDKIERPVLVRLKKTKNDDNYKKDFKIYGTCYYVNEFPYADRLGKQNVTEQLDLPIVFGSRILGKISIDNYSEELGREIFRFNENDMLITHVCSRIVGYVWESTKKEQLDDYIEGLEHEIIEPLHIIAGHTDFVRRYFDKQWVLQEKKLLKLEDIIQELELLDVIIRGPRVESIRKEDYEMVKVDFFNEIVLKAVVHIRDYYAKMKNVDIKHFEYFSIPEITVDKGKFQLVFYNLLINAVKYGDPSSTVWVNTRMENDSYIIDVENKGVSIAEEQEEKIFLKYYRALEGRDKDPGGKGLGLFIARLIVENHDGQLYVSKRESPVTFTIKLPVKLCL